MKFIIFFIFIYSSCIFAKPLYEVGLLYGRATVPDYPASDETTTHQLIFPSFVYRGFIFRSDDKGTRARFFSTKNMDVDLSFGASFPASANKNKAREDMDDLDWLGETGPRISYLVHKDEKNEIEIELPLRFVFSTDFQFTRHRGYRFQPQIDYRRRVTPRLTFSIGGKLNYGTEQLADYFYEVRPSDVTNERERYNAKGGYIGQDLSANLIYRYKKLISIIGMRTSQYHNSANENSPLYKARRNTSLFFAFNYFFYESKEQANKETYSKTPTL